ncbi:MAG: T4 RnlA family RNA ligase [Bacteroidota bacterium]
MPINQDFLQQMLAQNYVYCQKHLEANLWIYNYSAKTQYDALWNEITMQCRGLILNENFEYMARPFSKFFNLGERANQLIPDEPFEVYEKMDGSLGILYWIENEPFIATRGSFVSEQAKVANVILREKYKHAFEQLDRSKTYLFEIIYPQNRIVVDYGKRRELVLLAIINTATGAEESLQDIGFPVVKKYDGIQDIDNLIKLEEANREGFVIRFESGLRYKVKFKEYLRLHRIVTQVSSISIWEYLRAGKSFDEILEIVPDEWYAWINAKVRELNNAYKAIEKQCKNEFKVLEDRAETAYYFNQRDYPSILFAMLDGKPYEDRIWKLVRPEFEQPRV